MTPNRADETKSPAPRLLKIVAIINREAGTVRQRGADVVQALVEKHLAHAGDVDVRLVDGRDLQTSITNALRKPACDILVVGGGDGSVASAASLLLGSDVILGILPLGTFNVFTRALGFPQDLESCLAKLAVAVPQSVDTADVNGQLFLHQVSFGLQPRMVRLRERIGYRSRLTKMLTAVVAMTVVLARPRTLRFIVEQGVAPGAVTGSSVLVSNNLYSASKPLLPDRLDGGVLGLYVVAARSIGDYVRIAFDYLRGDWKSGEAVKEHPAASLVLRPRQRRFAARRPTVLLASIDGELVYLESPFQFALKPKSLRVLAPAPQENEGT